MSVTADGPGSVVRLDALTQFQDVDGSQLSAWTVRNAGEIHAPQLASMSGAALALDGTGTMPVAQLASFTEASLTVREVDVLVRRVGEAWRGRPCRWMAGRCRRAP